MALQMAERALQCNYIRKDPQTTLSSMGPGAAPGPGGGDLYWGHYFY